MAKQKKLTKAEHLEMELNAEQIRGLRLESALLLEKKASKLLRVKIAELENQRMIINMNNTIDNLKQRIELAEKDSSNFTGKLKEKYKIKTSFGINPDTGEILEDE